jgi:SAM-dependent methyltransferase
MCINYSIFRDPYDGNKLELIEDILYNHISGMTYQVVNGIPRFVAHENYSDSFGFQWNEFRKTQLDSYNKTKITYDRLERCLQGNIKELFGKLILEAGSGAGRFTEILLECGSHIHSFDLSNAVDANYYNNGSSKNLTLAQADIRHMPFEKKIYDYVICLGVIQHTPSPEESIFNLYQMLKPGGALVFDHYLFKLRNILPPPIGSANIIYRQIMLIIPIKFRFRVVKFIVDLFFPVHWIFRKSNTIQRILRRISPVHFYFNSLNLKIKNVCYEWALLDTHDSTTDYYKHHRSISQINNFLANLGASEISVRLGGNGIEVLCKKPLI